MVKFKVLLKIGYHFDIGFIPDNTWTFILQRSDWLAIAILIVEQQSGQVCYLVIGRDDLNMVIKKCYFGHHTNGSYLNILYCVYSTIILVIFQMIRSQV